MDVDDSSQPSTETLPAAAHAGALAMRDEGPVRRKRPRRKIDRGLLVASIVIAAGATLIVWGMLNSVTGNDGVDRPDAIESLSPVEGSLQVLRQERIVVDFQFGYEAVLLLDGIELPIELLGRIEAEPGQQIPLPTSAVFDAGNAILSYQPVEGAPIEELTPGLHEATVIYWRTEDGPDTARSYTWTFNVI